MKHGKCSGVNVRVVPYDPNWAADFAAEAERIRSVLGDAAIAVHHIGSTAIPGIWAKPIIDILVEVNDLETLESRSAALAELGYEAKGEFGIAGRRYFRKQSGAGVRTHQIHAFEKGSLGSERHLAFRDYMIAHPAEAQAYSLLKQRLAGLHPDNIESYMDGKDSFIKEQESKAIAWRRGQAGATPMQHVTGIGGLFFRSKNPALLSQWYKEHFRIEAV